MSKSINIRYEGVGYNGPVLAKMDWEEFKLNVSLHFTGPDAVDKMLELQAIIQEAYPVKE